VETTPRIGSVPESSAPRPCDLCGLAAATIRLPFAVGRQETPPIPREYRILGLGPKRKRFFQRHRWIWNSLQLCDSCGRDHASDRIWSRIQNHPETVRLVRQGYSETRLDPAFPGSDGAVTFTEEPVGT
jgi:hypothetical protein